MITEAPPEILQPIAQASSLSLEWYKPGVSLKEFHESSAFVRTVVGGRGSGKTTSTALDAVRHGLHNPGAKVLGLRKTEISQTDTTIDTFKQVFEQLGDLFMPTETSLFKQWRDYLTVRFPSLEAIERYNKFLATGPSRSQIEFWLGTEGNKWCSWLEFRGLPDAAKRGNKLRGFECSMAVLIEADLLVREDLDLTIACLRWKNARGKFIEDTGVIIDTNPPSPNHWIAKLEEEHKHDKPGPRAYKFWHIKTDENSHNLPPNYVDNLKQTYKNNPPMYKRMVLGEYAEAFDGAPVLYAFSEPAHAFEDLPFPANSYLVRGWDFGVTNACVFSAYWEFEGEEYWWDLKEIYAEDSDVDRQCRDVLRVTATDFPFWNDRTQCAGVLDYCDPAGAARKDTGSSLAVLATYGIFPGYKTKNRSLKDTIAVYNRLLERKDQFNQNVYRLDRKNCPKLYVATLGGYRYPREGEPGFGKDEPLKGPRGGNYDHIVDAARYAKINCLRLAKMDQEAKAANVGQLARKWNINPKRRIY